MQLSVAACMLLLSACEVEAAGQRSADEKGRVSGVSAGGALVLFAYLSKSDARALGPRTLGPRTSAATLGNAERRPGGSNATPARREQVPFSRRAKRWAKQAVQDVVSKVGRFLSRRRGGEKEGAADSLLAPRDFVLPEDDAPTGIDPFAGTESPLGGPQEPADGLVPSAIADGDAMPADGAVPSQDAMLTTPDGLEPIGAGVSSAAAESGDDLAEPGAPLSDAGADLPVCTGLTLLEEVATYEDPRISQAAVVRQSDIAWLREQSPDFEAPQFGLADAAWAEFQLRSPLGHPCTQSAECDALSADDLVVSVSAEGEQALKLVCRPGDALIDGAQRDWRKHEGFCWPEVSYGWGPWCFTDATDQCGEGYRCVSDPQGQPVAIGRIAEAGVDGQPPVELGQCMPDDLYEVSTACCQPLGELCTLAPGVCGETVRFLESCLASDGNNSIEACTASLTAQVPEETAAAISALQQCARTVGVATP